MVEIFTKFLAMSKHDTDLVENVIQRKGLFQLRLALALTLLSLPNGSQVLIAVFLTYLPDHSCQLPANMTLMVGADSAELAQYDVSRSVEVSNGNDSYRAVVDSCSVTYTHRVDLNQTISMEEELARKDHISSCESWKFHTEGEDVFSAAMEFEWVCSRAWMGPFLFSVQMFGLMAGSTFGGAIPDRFGRRRPYIITVVLKHTFMFLAGFSPNSYVLFILMGLSFVSTMIQSLTGVILATETLHDSMRQVVPMTQMGLYAVGYMVLPLFAYHIPNWRYLTFVTGFVGFLSFPLLLLVVESPRWLMLKGRKEEAISVLKKIVKINKVDEEECRDIFASQEMSSLSSSADLSTSSDDISSEENDVMICGKRLEDLNNNNSIDEVQCKKVEDENNNNSDLVVKLLDEKICSKEEEDRVKPQQAELTYLDLFRKKCLRYRIFICCLSWCSVNLSYYGSSFNTNELGGSRYMNCFYLGAVEVPGFILCIYLLRRIGARLTNVFFVAASTVFLIATAYCQSVSQQTALIVCAMSAKMMISGSFNVNYVYTGDIFPTLIRNQAYGTCSFISRIASILTPYLLYMGKLYSMSIPYMVMAFVSVFTSIAFYHLPETKNRPIPDTFQDILQQEKEKMNRKKLICRRHRQKHEDLQVNELQV